MLDFVSSASLLLALLNPFLLIVYFVDLLEKLDQKQFSRVMVRALVIASVAFSIFAVVGDAIFSKVIHAEFASFQIFGGIIFVLIGIQFLFQGPMAIRMLRGESEHVSGAIAMPVLIGPATISASIIIGEKHEPLLACAAVVAGTVTSILMVMALKWVHDVVRPRNEPLIRRYIEIAGRITALYVGTVAVDMIMQGLRTWYQKI